jgi:hypothetical protein
MQYGICFFFGYINKSQWLILIFYRTYTVRTWSELREKHVMSVFKTTLKNLKGLSHEMNLAFDDMYGYF